MYHSANQQQNKNMPSNVFNIIAEKSNDFFYQAPTPLKPTLNKPPLATFP